MLRDTYPRQLLSDTHTRKCGSWRRFPGCWWWDTGSWCWCHFQSSNAASLPSAVCLCVLEPLILTVPHIPQQNLKAQCFESAQNWPFLPVIFWFWFWLEAPSPPSAPLSAHTSVMFSLADTEEQELTRPAASDKLCSPFSLFVFFLPPPLPPSDAQARHTLAVSNWQPAASDPKRSHARRSAFPKLSSPSPPSRHLSFYLSFVAFLPVLSVPFSLCVFVLRAYGTAPSSALSTHYNIIF